MGPGELSVRMSEMLAAHVNRVAAANARLQADLLALFQEVGDAAGGLASAEARLTVQNALRQSAPVNRVIDAVADLSGFTARQLTGPSRAKELARTRQVAMAVAHERTGASMPAIGRAFGGRDHTTVHHAVETVRARMNRDLRATMDLIATRAGFPAQAAAP